MKKDGIGLRWWSSRDSSSGAFLPPQRGPGAPLFESYSFLQMHSWASGAPRVGKTAIDRYICCLRPCAAPLASRKFIDTQQKYLPLRRPQFALIEYKALMKDEWLLQKQIDKLLQGREKRPFHSPRLLCGPRRGLPRGGGRRGGQGEGGHNTRASQPRWAARLLSSHH